MIVFQTFIKDGQKAAAALDSVTDHVEEKETEASTASKSHTSSLNLETTRF